MPRTIKEIELGSSVWAREGDQDVEFILTRKDSSGCEIHRKKAYMNRRMHSTNTAIYEDCEADQWLINEETGYLSLFSPAFRSNVINRSISTFTYGDSEYHEISRRCYLYSYGDYFLSTPTELYKEVSVVQALMINKNVMDANNARIARNNADTDNVNVWTRSANSAASFWYVYDIGAANNYYATHSRYWVRPVLNMSLDTIVSDEGASQILILPEEKPRAVEFKGRAGTSEARPKKVLVRVDSHNLVNQELKVSINYDDPEPVWQTVINNEETVITNETKQSSDWVIGVHCYGETPDLTEGYFREPIIVVEV